MIIHITAPSGTGKTTLVNKYKSILNHTVIKDTDKILYNRNNEKELYDMNKLENKPIEYKEKWDKFSGDE